MEKNIQIQPTGSYFEIDSEGYIINPASLEKIQEEYRPVIADIINVYKQQYGENLKSIYIRGSVAKGQAVKDVSDLDSFCFVDPQGKSISNSWSYSPQKELENKYPFLEHIEIVTRSIEDVVSNNIMLNQSLCVFGEPVPVIKIKPGQETMLHIPKFERRHSVFENIMQNATTPEEIKSACVWTMKDILRTAFEITMERSKKYTRDLYRCYEGFSEYYPEKKDFMYQVLFYALNPIDEKQIIRKTRESFFEWLSNELENFE